MDLNSYLAGSGHHDDLPAGFHERLWSRVELIERKSGERRGAALGGVLLMAAFVTGMLTSSFYGPPQTPRDILYAGHDRTPAVLLGSLS